MRRMLLLSLTTMVVALLLAGGVALAANIQCQGGLCVGTEQNDRITGSQEIDVIQALGGRDDVTARGGGRFCRRQQGPGRHLGWSRRRRPGGRWGPRRHRRWPGYDRR